MQKKLINDNPELIGMEISNERFQDEYWDSVCRYLYENGIDKTVLESITPLRGHDGEFHGFIEVRFNKRVPRKVFNNTIYIEGLRLRDAGNNNFDTHNVADPFIINKDIENKSYLGKYWNDVCGYLRYENIDPAVLESIIPSFTHEDGEFHGFIEVRFNKSVPYKVLNTTIYIKGLRLRDAGNHKLDTHNVANCFIMEQDA